MRIIFCGIHLHVTVCWWLSLTCTEPRTFLSISKAVWQIINDIYISLWKTAFLDLICSLCWESDAVAELQFILCFSWISSWIFYPSKRAEESRAVSSSQASGLFVSFFRYQTNCSIKPQSKPKLSGMERTTRINQNQMLLINRWAFYAEFYHLVLVNSNLRSW